MCPLTLGHECIYLLVSRLLFMQHLQSFRLYFVSDQNLCYCFSGCFNPSSSPISQLLRSLCEGCGNIFSAGSHSFLFRSACNPILRPKLAQEKRKDKKGLHYGMCIVLSVNIMPTTIVHGCRSMTQV